MNPFLCTWGIPSVNDMPNIPIIELNIENREYIDTTIKIVSFIVNFLGYLPYIGAIVGLGRIAFATKIIYDFYLHDNNDAISTVSLNFYFLFITQIARGILEIIPYGRLVNAAGDIVTKGYPDFFYMY